MSETLSFTHYFPYSCFTGGIVKPVIPVSFSYKGYEFTYPMLVDSGAIGINLPLEFAVSGFEIDINTLPEGISSGIGGDVRWRKLNDVTIIIAENEIEFQGPVYFIEECTAARMPYGLLGRESVFDTLRIGFREYKRQYIYFALDKE